MLSAGRVVKKYEKRGDHYIPLSTKESPTKPLPDLPENWVEEVQISKGFTVAKTRSGWMRDEVSACMQGYVRRGEFVEAANMVLEMLCTGCNWEGRKSGGVGTNCWNRLFIMCSENISLANNCAIVEAARLSNTTFDSFEEECVAALKFAWLLCACSKSRVCDWACHGYPKPYDDTFSACFDELYSAMLSKDTWAAAGWRRQIHDMITERENEGVAFDVDLWNKWSADHPVKYYANERQIIWAVIYSALPDEEYHPDIKVIVDACYDIAHTDHFRWKDPMHLFENHAIFAICERETVQEKGLEMPDHLDGYLFCGEKNLGIFIRRFLKRGMTWGLPTILLCKHTAYGKTKLGHGLQHFIEVKCHLNNEADWLKELSDKFLVACFDRSWNEGRRLGESNMSPVQYKRWVKSHWRKHMESYIGIPSD